MVRPKIAEQDVDVDTKLADQSLHVLILLVGHIHQSLVSSIIPHLTNILHGKLTLKFSTGQLKRSHPRSWTKSRLETIVEMLAVPSKRCRPSPSCSLFWNSPGYGLGKPVGKWHGLEASLVSITA